MVIIGGGLSGVCAALASARQGAKTAIVQARSMFGGNNSSEVRMHVCGANCHA
ncbi:MAG: FAD-dependent oxidoreductase [Firmicutes bacterium]|nr:FAD-dependent oxidoreductase [Bacillota bacterium]